MSDKKKEQQIKPERKIKDEHFKPSASVKKVSRNDGAPDSATRIDQFEKKK